MGQNSIKYCTELVQNMPMIHFQYNEEELCLRPSEVKPQLDKFIIEQLGGWEKIPKEWHVDDTHHALRYKMRITAEGIPTRCKPHKLYFANMNDEENEEAVSFSKMKLTIICNCTGTALEFKLSDKKLKLMEIIQGYLPYFFAVHTFGKRNSKGFGSFSVKDNPVDFNKLWQFCPLKQYYYIQYVNRSKADAESIFDDIWVIYNMMKSGFNHTEKFEGNYYKGRIFRYFSQKGMGSDKAFIKKNILPLGDCREDVAYEQFCFSRAMLGLSEHYVFRETDKIKRSGTVNITHNGKDDFKIERFQSPIRFKLHEKRLLIIPQIIPKRMFNAEFIFECPKEDKLNIIKTPSEDGNQGFRLIEYLDWFVQEYNKQTDLDAFTKSEKSVVAPTIRKKLEIKKEARPSE